MIVIDLDVPREDIPAQLAELERAKAELWLRLQAPPAPAGPDNLLTAKAVVERWPDAELTTGRLYELVRQGRIPSVRLGRQVRFPERQIAAWISEGGTA